MTREWMDDALCASTDPDAFNPAKGGSYVRARAVCAVCEVRVECLDYAVSNHPMPGIWAGTNERERSRMKREAA